MGQSMGQIAISRFSPGKLRVLGGSMLRHAGFWTAIGVLLGLVGCDPVSDADVSAAQMALQGRDANGNQVCERGSMVWQLADAAIVCVAYTLPDLTGSRQ